MEEISKTYDNRKPWTGAQFTENVKLAYILQIQENDLMDRLNFIKTCAKLKKENDNYDFSPILNEIKNTKPFEELRISEIYRAAEQFGITKKNTTVNRVIANYIIFPNKGN